MSVDTDLPPTKYGTKGLTSHIPGLGQCLYNGPEEKPRGRRAGVREDDSDYIKLAKQGGQKDLLRHDETVLPKQMSYRPPNWFGSVEEDSGDDPSLIKDGEEKASGAHRLLNAPFGTDGKSAWERDVSSKGKKKGLDNIPSSQMEKLSLSSPQDENHKFRKVAFDKNPAPVNMSKLLSFGYLEEDDKPTPAEETQKDKTTGSRPMV